MKKITDKLKWFLNVDFPENILSTYSQDELHRIKIVNYICLITISNMLLYIGIYSLLDFNLFKPAIYFLTFCSFLTIGIIVVNKKGFYNTAKLLVGILTPFYMTTVVLILFGKRPDFQVFLLLACTIPVFIWTFKQKFHLIFFIILYFVIYILLEFFTLPFDHLINIPEKFISIFHSSNIIICFLGMGTAIGVYQWFINIKEKQLIEKAEELKDSQKHKDIVYSIIAHDLKGPIGSFVGLTEFFLNKSENFKEEKYKTIVERMHQSSGSLQSLLEDLLDWSKMQSGNLEQNRANINIREIADNAIQLYRELFTEKSIKIEIDIDPNITGFGDNYMISTVFRNLISNAIKFSPQKGLILIRAVLIQREIEICISDSGIGLSENEIKNLFSFQNIGFEQKAEKTGGLGLLVCKDFIESNNGKLWVKSEPDEGSRFYFTIKLAE